MSRPGSRPDRGCPCRRRRSRRPTSWPGWCARRPSICPWDRACAVRGRTRAAGRCRRRGVMSEILDWGLAELARQVAQRGRQQPRGDAGRARGAGRPGPRSTRWRASIRTRQGRGDGGTRAARRARSAARCPDAQGHVLPRGPASPMDGALCPRPRPTVRCSRDGRARRRRRHRCWPAEHGRVRAGHHGHNPHTGHPAKFLGPARLTRRLSSGGAASVAARLIRLPWLGLWRLDVVRPRCAACFGSTARPTRAG